MKKTGLMLLAAALAVAAGYAEPVNMVANGSFEIETNKGVPDGWRIYWNWCKGGYFGQYENAAPKYWEEKLGKKRIPAWGPDTETASDGKKSLKIVHPASFIFATIHSQVPAGKLEKGKTYEFSFYMKSDREGLPIDAGLYSKPYQTFKTTRSWKRYAIEITPEKNRRRTMVVFRFSRVPVKDYAELCKKAEAGEIIDSPDAVATYWIDDVQMKKKVSSDEEEENDVQV